MKNVTRLEIIQALNKLPNPNTYKNNEYKTTVSEMYPKITDGKIKDYIFVFEKIFVGGSYVWLLTNEI